ncbi:MAG: 6-phosphofructokinase [Myxococcota bacterium]
MDNGAHRGSVRRVGIVFSGGPAPGANAVIAAAAYSFMEDKREVVGFFHGYSHLMEYHPVSRRLVPDEHYRLLTQRDVSDLRNARGVLIGTSRAHPGAGITRPEDLDDPEKTARLRNVYAALIDLGIDALISIGGDGTLATASYLHHYQQNLPPEAKRIAIVHVPKTIDNDYGGIDFTFGFFTAVDVLTKELMNLRADAIATGSYFIVETMGRKAGWLAYGVAIAGEANLVVAPEDVDDAISEDGYLSLDKLAHRIVDTMVARDRRGKHYGTVVLAEGLVGMLSPDDLASMERDKFGHVSHGGFAIGKMTAQRVTELYEQRTGFKKKVRGLQIGYESRSAPPHAFDVMLGSQLGIGAYRALVEEGLDSHMVSVRGQFNLHYVPFAELVDEQTLRVAVRLIEPGSDFHRLARFLETRVDHVAGTDTIYPGRRPEHG